MLKLFRNIYRALFHPEEGEGMNAWAFGDNWYNLNMIERMQEWNKLHSDLCVFCPSDPIAESMDFIKKHWKEYLKGKNKRDARKH